MHVFISPLAELEDWHVMNTLRPLTAVFSGTFQKALFASRNAFMQYLYSCHTFYTRDLPVKR